MKKVGIIGAGKMGEAIISGLIKAGQDKNNLFFSEALEERRKYVEEKYGIEAKDTENIFKDCDITIIAVKPQDIKAAIEGFDASNILVVSIAAGVKSSVIGSILKNGNRVVRVMPNLPLVVGEGMVVVFKGPLSQEKDVEEVVKLFSPMGETVVLDERYADAVTALSGSGPGFVAIFSEALEDAGVLLGLPRDIARKLAIQTVMGSSRYMKELGISPPELKAQVSSPGGTTIAGILQMEKDGLRGTVMEALKKAYERSKEL